MVGGKGMVLWHNLPQVLSFPIMRPSLTQFQAWQGDRYAYEVVDDFEGANPEAPPLLFVHPIGVGLSRRFWDRFTTAWLAQAGNPGGAGNIIYNPDLMGCGESDMPCLPYRPLDWAKQLQDFIDNVIQRPVIVVVQGALFPAAIDLVKIAPQSVAGLVLSGPPAWRVMIDVASERQQNIAWSLFKSPLGALFYRYARRRKFLQDFSRKQLFASDSPIDAAWLDPLVEGAKDPASRHAVFAFLSRFWQRGYGDDIRAIAQPTQVLFGLEASSVSRSGKSESPEERLKIYLDALPAGQGQLLPGRNVLPFEETDAFCDAVVGFVRSLS